MELVYNDARADYTYDNRFNSKATRKTEPSVYAGQNKITKSTYDDFENITELTVNGFTSNGLPVSRTITLTYSDPLNQLSQVVV